MIADLIRSKYGDVRLPEMKIDQVKVPMYAKRKKVQPLCLNDLLKMRKELETRLRSMRIDGVVSAAPLEDLYERCKTAIRYAQSEQSISR